MKCVNRLLISLVMIATLPITAACSPPVPEAKNSPAKIDAVAKMQPTQGNQVAGTINLTRLPQGVRIAGEIKGLPRAGLYGIHIHEKGDCSAPDATSAGGHFNPDGTPHGSPDMPANLRHAGDLGNLVAGPDGTARFERIDHVMQLSGPNAVVGRAFIIHAQPDDLVSQPTGNAGARLSCGIIEQSRP